MVGAKKQNQSYKQIKFKIDPIIVDPSDPRVYYCEYCKKPMILAMGQYGFSCYVAYKREGQFRSELTKKHYGPENRECLKKWMKESKHREGLLEKPCYRREDKNE